MAKTSIDDLAIVLSASSDRLAGDLRAAARMVENFAKQVDKASAGTGAESVAAKRMAQELMAAKRNAREVADIHRGARSAAAGLRGGFGGVASALEGTVNAAAQAKEAYTTAGMSGVASFAKMTGTLLAAGLALDAIAVAGEQIKWIFGQLKDSVRLAADLEQTTMAMEVMLGTAKEAQQMVGGLREFAAATPFNSSEVNKAGKQLLAYGVAADQVIPTLRMLGDVSAAFGKDLPLKDLVTKYGQVFASQKAFTEDIKELAERGVPVFDELAKVMGVTTAEVRSLAEAGRIGRDDYTKAFISMTSAGGRFFGMMKRQSETFQGQWDQFVDAIELGKAALGKVLIRDLGLKEAVANGRELAQQMEGIAENLSPAVKFAGALGHAVGQVGFQFGKAAFEGANFADTLIDHTFPEVKAAAQSLKRDLDTLLAGGKEFKILPSEVATVMKGVGNQLADIFIEILRGIKAIGDGIRDNVVKPIVQGMENMFGTFIEAKDFIGASSTAERYRPPASFESDESVVKRYRALFNELAHVQGQLEPLMPKERELGAGKVELQPMAKPLRPDQVVLRDALLARQKELKGLDAAFMGKFTTPNNFPFVKHKLIEEGKVPTTPTRNGGIVAGGDASGIDVVISAFQSRRATANAFADAQIAKMHAKEIADEIAKVTRERKQMADAGSPFAAAGALGPYAGAALAYSGAIAAPKSEVRLQNDLPAGAAELKKNLLDRYDPLREGGEFSMTKKNLDALLGRGEISPSIHALGMRDAALSVAERVGVGPTQSPDGALAGTTEAARTIANSMNQGGQRDGTQGLLARILAVLERTERKEPFRVETVNAPK